MNDPLIHALEQDRSGFWSAAHQIVQEIESKEAARIHAYLHREEGDLDNAQYWYNRAGEPMPECTLNEEWQELYSRFA